MRFIGLKSQEQLDMQMLYRVWSRLVAERTRLINQLRAILMERGIIFPEGRRKFELGVDGMLAGEDESALSRRVLKLVGERHAEWNELDAKIQALNGEFVDVVRNDASARRLTSIPGIGDLNATVLIAAVGDANSFDKGRDLGSWLGLVPRQHTTGGNPSCSVYPSEGILFEHPAHPRRRAALPSLSQSDWPLGRWRKAMIERGVHRNAIVVALANKLARIAWAALRKETRFERLYPVMA